MEPLLTWGLTTLGTAFVGSYLAGYLKKKGENLATHEDIDKLVAQMAAVTSATKEIEAKISGDLWDRQMRWNQKRDIYGRLLDALDRIQMSLRRALAADEAFHIYHGETAKEAAEAFAQAQKDVAALTGEFIRATTLARLFASPDALSVLDQIRDCVLILGQDLLAQEGHLETLYGALIGAAKSDLELA